MRRRGACITRSRRMWRTSWRRAVAEALGGVPLPFILPLPGSAGVGRHQHLKGPSNWALQSDLIRRAPQPAAPAAEPVKAPAPFRPSAPAVMLGAGKAGGEVFWAPFESTAALLNSGVLVTGDPGSGKTQTLNVLIDGVAGMGLPICIFDFKNDYSERGFVQAIGLKVHDVRQRGLPFNPLMPSFNAEGLAQPIEHIFTIAGVLNRVFDLGPRQHAILRDAMKEAFEQRGVDPQAWVRADACRAPSFEDVVAILEAHKKDGPAAGLRDRLAPLVELRLFPKAEAAPFEAMLDERVVLSLFALPADDIKAALAELIIIRLHGVLVNRPQPRKLTRLLVLDEAWRVASSKHLENLAREGRAFGAGIAIGTQYPGDLPADLSGALGTKIYLKNQQPDHKKAVVTALCGANSGPDAANLHGTLEQLGQFEGLIQNQQYLPFAEFKLTPYFKRARQHAHRQAPEATGEPSQAAWASARPDAPKPAPAAPAPAAAQPKDRAGEAAQKWLAARLADGEWHDSASILPAWHQWKGGKPGEDIKAKPTLYRARDALGVVTRKRTDSGSSRLAVAQSGGQPVTDGAFLMFAEALLDAGYSPLPILPGRKKPALREWSDFCAAPMTRGRIQGYGARWPRASLGVALGFAGVVALDVDTEDEGQLAAIRAAVPASPVAKAGAKGFTAFYRAAPGAVIPSRHFAAGRKQGICDLLSTGTQTVLPPSPHPAGHAYRWLAADTLLTVPASELPEAPADLAGRLEDALAPWMPKPRFDARYERRTTPPAGHELRRLTAFAKSALSAWSARLAETAEGGRNNTLFALGCVLGKYVIHGILDAAVIEAAALAACEANGMRREDGRLAVLATLHSGIARAKGDALPALKERTFKRRKPARERGLSVSTMEHRK